jgi:hypothetical protein
VRDAVMKGFDHEQSFKTHKNILHTLNELKKNSIDEIEVFILNHI